MVKDTSLTDPHSQFTHPQNWRDLHQREIAVHRRVDHARADTTDASGFQHLIQHHGHHILMHEHYYRVYLEYCTYGSLKSVKETIEDTVAGQKKDGSDGIPYPEPFIWFVFRALVKACLVFRDGPIGPQSASRPQPWKPITHKDIADRNIFFSESAGGGGAAKVCSAHLICNREEKKLMILAFYMASTRAC